MGFIKNYLNTATILFCSIVLYVRISTIETNVKNQIENTINRYFPKPDTSRIVKAPPLKNIGDYYYFSGKVKGKSQKFLDLFEYDPRWPREIWEGYLTVVVGNNGVDYYVWSENAITKGIELSMWTVADPQKFEIGYHKQEKDKIYGQILYPIVSIRKSTNIN